MLISLRQCIIVHTHPPIEMTKVSYQASVELKELLEDTLEYWCDTKAKEGEFIGGETAWLMVEAVSQAKQAQMAGEIE